MREIQRKFQNLTRKEKNSLKSRDFDRKLGKFRTKLDVSGSCEPFLRTFWENGL